MDQPKTDSGETNNNEKWAKLLKRIQVLEVVLTIFVCLTTLCIVDQKRKILKLSNAYTSISLQNLKESVLEPDFDSNTNNLKHPLQPFRLGESEAVFGVPTRLETTTKNDSKKQNEKKLNFLSETEGSIESTFLGNRQKKLRMLSFNDDLSQFNVLSGRDGSLNIKENEFVPDRHLLQSRSNDFLASDVCNGTLFYLELYLDEFPEETYWELALIDNDDETLIATESYPNHHELIYSNQSFDICLANGKYLFTLYDIWGDGIRCKDPFQNCYTIYLDNEVAEVGPPFEDLMVQHEIDLSPGTLCTVGYAFLLEIEGKKFDFSNGDEMKWILRNERTNQQQSFTEIPHGLDDMRETSRKLMIESYFTCIGPGKYTFGFFDSNGDDMICRESHECYRLYLDGTLLISANQVQSFFRNSNHAFIITETGVGKEQVCSNLNDLSPAHPYNNFTYDDYFFKRMGLIYSVTPAEKIQNRSTSQSKAACWILIDDLLSSTNDASSVVSDLWLERYALAVFLFSVNKNIDALQTNSCEFESTKVVCNERGQIIALDYFGNRLKGTIPPEISLLRHLENLDIGDNSLEGTIPGQLGRLSNLRTLYLDKNKFTGRIPSLIGRVTRLEELAISDNSLIGTIPPALGQNIQLRKLLLSENKLEGSIPSSIFKCINLAELNLQKNSLIGEIPSQFGELINLVHLNLEDNFFSGTIPSDIWKLSLLKNLIVDVNKLTGTLPSKIGEMMSLERLVASANSLTGRLPSIPSSSNLNVISLEFNQFTGSIPASYFDLDLDFLWLRQNDLVGDVPNEFCEKIPDGLSVDDREWLLHEPKVNCSCCNKAACHIWNTTDENELFRPCPNGNLHKLGFVSVANISDLITNEKRYYDFNGFNGFKELNLCLSQTGCYSFEYGAIGEVEGLVENKAEFFEYSDSEKKLKRQDLLLEGGCPSVMICGVSIHKNHPKRIGLNQFTQLVLHDMTLLDDPSSPGYKALCWAMTQDRLYDNYRYCDGTLLQRFVLIYFYYTEGFLADFEELSLLDTCDWPGISCDSYQQFVTSIDLSNQNLTGTLTTEIGLLTTLENINLSNNDLKGNIDESLHRNLHQIKFFNIGNNSFGGAFPYEILSHPHLVELNISGNNFVGRLPSFTYSRDLAIFDVSDNLFQGNFPPALINCKNLTYLDLSQNNFNGNIPTEIGTLLDMQSIRFYDNKFVGSIPIEIFDSIHIKEFMLQSNRLTGSIPMQISNLQNVSVISLNHNQLKGTIPVQLESLKKIEKLHLHNNRLHGIAPILASNNFLQSKDAYITDCGDPSYLLPSALTCTTCTMCCNSEGKCQEKPNLGFYIWIVFVLIAPFAFAIISLFTKKARDQFECRDPMNIFCEDTVYCFLLTGNFTALFIHLTTATLQTLLFVQYISASRFQSEATDWQFTFICPNNDQNCTSEDTRNIYGWFLFFVVTFGYLGIDYTMSIFQIQQAIYMEDWKLLASGCLLLSLTLLGTISSFLYNFALADSNTALISNAVILLFINDMDEKILQILQVIVPEWTIDRLDEARESMIRRSDIISKHISEKNSINFHEEEESVFSEHDEESIPVGAEVSNGQVTNNSKILRRTSYVEARQGQRVRSVIPRRLSIPKNPTYTEVSSPLTSFKENSSSDEPDTAIGSGDEGYPSLILPVLYSSPTSETKSRHRPHITHRDYFSGEN